MNKPLARDTTATRVVVASKNPVKISVAKNAFLAMFYPRSSSFIERVALFIHRIFNPHQYLFPAIDAPSGVSAQPITLEETKQGALNRLKYSEELCPLCDFWVAMEGGVLIEGLEVVEIGFVAIKERGYERIAWAEISRFPVPYQVGELIRQGMEMGLANDKAFDLTNSKQQGGMPGIITKFFDVSVLTRKDVYYQAAVLAFAQLRNKHLYPEHH